MKIRSITLFDDLDVSFDRRRLAELGALAQSANQAFTAAGYEVQTQRLALDMRDKLDGMAAAALADWASELEAACQSEGFAYVALGAVNAVTVPKLPAAFAATQGVFRHGGYRRPSDRRHRRRDDSPGRPG